MTPIGELGCQVPRWTSPALSAGSGEPGRASGLSQVFAAHFIDPTGVSDLSYVGLDIDYRIATDNSCYVLYRFGE